MVSVAKGVHANRITEGTAIVSPVGNPNLTPEQEKKWRRSLLERALNSLQSGGEGAM
jgi:betaine reductase